MCNVEVTSKTDLSLDYLDDCAGVSILVVQCRFECRKTAVLTNFHSSCNFGFSRNTRQSLVSMIKNAKKTAPTSFILA